VRGVVQAPLGRGNLLGEGLGVGELALEAAVVRHRGQGVLHDHIVLIRDEAVVGAAGRLGRAFIVPVHLFVVRSPDGVDSAVVPVRVSGGSSPCVPVGVFATPLTPTSPSNIR